MPESGGLAGLTCHPWEDKASLGVQPHWDSAVVCSGQDLVLTAHWCQDSRLALCCSPCGHFLRWSFHRQDRESYTVSYMGVLQSLYLSCFHFNKSDHAYDRRFKVSKDPEMSGFSHLPPVSSSFTQETDIISVSHHSRMFWLAFLSDL